MFHKWFLIGFVSRLVLAVLITLLIRYDVEASMLYFADLPLFIIVALLERIVSTNTINTLTGSHPYYIPMNLFASVLWGSLFTLVPIASKVISWLRRSSKPMTTRLH
jgi:hypothetical protein